MDNRVDLFDKWEELPPYVQELIDLLNEAVDNGYDLGIDMITKLINKHGFQFDMDADGTPVNLRCVK